MSEYDFGFSFSDSDTAAPAPISEDTLQDIQQKLDAVLSNNSTLVEDKYISKLKEVESLILPLLYNLMKNPEKAYIKWENRAPIIQAQIDKITAITRDV